MARFATSPALLAALMTTTAAAQTPARSFVAETLGPGVIINDMNESGQVVGWALTSNVQAFLAGPGGAYQLLPLPAGYASAWAQGINDAGVVVGSVSTSGSPELGEALAWIPDGTGGFTHQFLGALPGHTQSVAHDVNNRGDIIGWSIEPGFSGGPTVWFNSPSGVLDLSALGAPGYPKEINDQGVMTGIVGELFDVDTLSVVPLPSFPSGWTGFQGWAINGNGELAGTGRHGSKRSAAIWTVAGDWQQLSLQFDQTASVQAFDINADGVTYAEVPAPVAYFPGFGVIELEELPVESQQGQLDFVLSLGGAVNDAGQIAAIAKKANGSKWVTLLTPVTIGPIGDAYCDPAVVNSSGLPGTLRADGTVLVTANQVTLIAEQLPVQQFGYFLASQTQGFIANPGGSQGNLCLGGQIGRYVQHVASTGAGGTLALQIDLTKMPAPLNVPVHAGETWSFQTWFRDKNPTTTSNFTHGLAITFE